VATMESADAATTTMDVVADVVAITAN